MNLSQIIDGIDGVTLRMADGSVEDAGTREISGLSADSRALRAGFLFAALPGAGPLAHTTPARDGRTYIAQAIAQGAVAVLVPKDSVIAPTNGLAIVEADEPRRALALMAARFYEHQPEQIVAVTGTNGKSSIVTFCRQIWQQMHIPGASLGTIGITACLPDGQVVDRAGALTTPDPISLHSALADLAQDGVTHVAMEASSQGLDQHRTDGVLFKAAAFTNLTRDHLDYHGTMDAYLAAKLRLFTENLAPGGVAVLNRDMDCFAEVVAACRARSLSIIDVSTRTADSAIFVRAARPLATGRFLSLSIYGENIDLELPLIGDFQAMNALMALGLVIAERPDDIDFRHRALAALKHLSSVRGRLELATTLHSGAAIYVDYAHTPDGLETMLRAVRPHCRGRLHVVFGCGGDRDRGKRPAMAKIAAALADAVIITDDNPRSEDPAAIRREAMAGIDAIDAARVRDIGGRRDAIAAGISALGPDDVLVVAGKGHEQGQTINGTTLPFDDASVIRELSLEHTT